MQVERLVPSVAVRVTVFSPRLLQSNNVWLSLIPTSMQLSVVLPPIWTGETMAFPFAPSSTVISSQEAVGGMLSVIVNVPVQEAVWPLASSTVRVMDLGPSGAQSKSYWSRVRLTMVQLSLLPSSICSGVTVIFPESSRYAVTSLLQSAVGGVSSTTVTTASQELKRSLPNAVRVTVFAPRSVH